MTSGDPYRQPARDPRRYVCICCHATYAHAPTPCPRCGVERLAADRADVREELLAEAQRRGERRLDSARFGRAFGSVRLMNWLRALLDDDGPEVWAVRAQLADLPDRTTDELIALLGMKPR